MDRLQDFAQKDMIEQIGILDDISGPDNTAYLPGLLEIYSDVKLDQAVEEMVYHTLFGLMAGQSEQIIANLKNPSSRIVFLAIRRACEDGDPKVLPALKSLLDESGDDEILSEVLRAFGNFADPSLVEVILPFLQHENSAVVAWAMHSLVELGGASAQAGLINFIEKNAVIIKENGLCDLHTTQAISSLAKFKNEEVAGFLIKYIHHPVAMFRKVVINALVSIGDLSLPLLGNCLRQGTNDEKIMASNVIGWIKHRKGADLLSSFLDETSEIETNLKFAIYEALGRIPSIRSFTLLTDGLTETDEMLLMAVVTGLNDLCNPGIVKTMEDLISAGGPQAERVLQTIIAVRAHKIFTALYNSQTHAEALLNVIAGSNDPETIAIFKKTLAEIDNERTAADIERLSQQKTQTKNRRIIAVDDSKAMLFFYKKAASDIGFELETFPDGLDALKYFTNEDNAAAVDLLVTDMNMPGMDGLELTRELRKIERWTNLPIVMATTETEGSQQSQAKSAGVNDFISKPFNTDDFKNKLNEML